MCAFSWGRPHKPLGARNTYAGRQQKRADTLRERLIFQALLLPAAGLLTWLNAVTLFSWERGASPVSGAVDDGAAYLSRDAQVCTSTNRTATCVTIPAGSPVEIFERSGSHSYVRAGGFSGFVKTSAIKKGN